VTISGIKYSEDEYDRELQSQIERHLGKQYKTLIRQKSVVKELEAKLKWLSEAFREKILRRGFEVKKIEPLFQFSQEDKIQLQWLRRLESQLSSSDSLWSIELYRQLGIEQRNQLGDDLWHTLFMRLEPLFHFSRAYIDVDSLVLASTKFDYGISVLNLPYEQIEWEALQSLVKNCGSMIFPYEEVCLVCDRPRILSFDNQQRLHAEGKPAIQFADGYSLYAYHGVKLPEKYGTLHPNQWQAKWLLEEDNAELRRVLTQGIGYERLIQELQATELDSYQEYTLLKIDNDVDIEPISLLKMICPSTGFIHVLRVPPDVNSAREAIHWVNWGIAPEEFAVQT
jgi:hypothetical protein